MVDRPILFSAPMVKAHFAGLKTQTRRTLNLDNMLDPMPHVWEATKINGVWRFVSENPDCGGNQAAPVRYENGDRLWVRETISFERKWTGTKPSDVPAGEPVWYWADGNPPSGDWTKPVVSIHMPRWASRLTDIVTDVRVQRLQEISDADAAAEGLKYLEDGPGAGFWIVDDTPVCGDGSIEAYAQLWEHINGAGSWTANPWIVALTFTVEKRNIDAMPARAAA